MRSLIRLVAVVLLGMVSSSVAAPAASGEFDHTHAVWGRVLARCVREGQVDYALLKGAPEDLDTYLGLVAAVPGDAFDQWSRDQRLALLLNLYNAQTLRLIADHYPVASIRNIGLLPGAAWKRQEVRFRGEKISLDDLEHGIVRKEFAEPRIHFALVCAAKGCPPLRAEPYVAERLEVQLDGQARLFLAQETKNRFDAESGTLWLSRIFEWYASDFQSGGRSVRDYVAPFLPVAAREAMRRTTTVQIRYTEYDWSLNGLTIGNTRPTE